LSKVRSLNKEHGVRGFERFYETGHTYRAESNATSRHLTEAYFLEVGFGFIDCPEDVIEGRLERPRIRLSRELLTHTFRILNECSFSVQNSANQWLT